MSRVLEAGECSCDCHDNDSVMHMMPCCAPCPVCRTNIAYGYEAHVEACKAEREKMLAEVRAAAARAKK